MHMLLRSVVFIAALFPTLAAPVTAQRLAWPLSFTVFGGAAFPLLRSSNELNTGYTIGGAVDLRVPITPFGGRLEGSYSRFSAKGLAGVSGHTSDLGANLNFVYWIPMSIPLPMSPYLTTGLSFSHLKGAVLSGGSGISETDNNWGLNGGGGIDFKIGTLPVRVDARYKRISSDRATFQAVPVTFGIRF
jgi:hypothetical protein